VAVVAAVAVVEVVVVAIETLTVAHMVNPQTTPSKPHRNPALQLVKRQLQMDQIHMRFVSPAESVEALSHSPSCAPHFFNMLLTLFG
jgi:hypothetical protein